jgi:polar amino acid transport system substrate-binding protein
VCIVTVMVLIGRHSTMAGVAAPPDLELFTEELEPFNMQVDGGVGGISTQVLAAAFASAQLPFKVQLVPWARAIGQAESLPRACVYSTAQLPERLPRFKWVGPIGHDNLVIFTRPDSSIKATTLDDLRGLHTATTFGDAAAPIMRSHGIEVELTPTQGQLRMLQSGRIDFWMTMESRGKLLGKANDVPLQTSLTVDRIDFYLACNPAVPDAVIDRLNQVLDRLRRDGTVDRITASFLQ